MNRIMLEKYFSTDRLGRYFSQCPGNESKAMYLYEANLLLSEALYTPLSLLEVALRNKINAELIRKFCRPDWYAEWYKHPVMCYAWNEVNTCIRHLHEDKKPIMPDKVVASLMFGFWTSLFNDRYERELWGHLRFVFPDMPKAIRQRKNISGPLNDIRRTLRNRVYHNEPIVFNLKSLQTHYSNIQQLLNWMGPDLMLYNKSLDRFETILKSVTNQLTVL